MLFRSEIDSLNLFFQCSNEQIQAFIKQKDPSIQWTIDDQSNYHFFQGKRFENIIKFYHYCKTLDSRKIDIYPTLLKITDLLKLKELERGLDSIFLGRPKYDCSNT